MKERKNSRAKGNRFELKVAKAFSEALGIEIRRTPLSGGWSHSNPETSGDLVCIGKDKLNFCIECKHVEGWRLESLFTDDHAWFDNWWMQLVNECPKDKNMVLVFTRNRCPIFAASPLGLQLDKPTLCIKVNGMHIGIENFDHYISTVKFLNGFNS